MRTVWQKFRLFLLRWHRRVGVFLFLFVVWMSISGIFLNHSDDLSLDEQTVGFESLVSWYSPEIVVGASYSLGDDQLIASTGGRLFINGQELPVFCQAGLVGVVAIEAVRFVGCVDTVSRLDANWQLVDQWDAADGVAVPLRRLGKTSDQIVLEGNSQQVWDEQRWEWANSKPSGDVVWSQPLPQSASKDHALSALEGPPVSWERVLLDLHTGRLFGTYGVWLVDFLALLLIAMAAGGVWIWLTKPGRFRRPG